MNYWQTLITFFKPLVRRARLAAETDTAFTLGARLAGSTERDRYDYDRQQVLEQTLEAWRVNPLARRMVELTTQYVVGGGLRVSSDHPATHAFLAAWWGHRLNQLAMRVYEWSDELVRAGELFLLVSTDAAGMSYVRAVPAAQIAEIITAENDVQQELTYVQPAAAPELEPRVWPAYAEQADQRGPDGSFAPVMLHYAINRPVGAVHGESDLAPALRWLARYAAWLEDRARLNRYRNSFLFVVKGRWASEAERRARQEAIALNPPSPGSILVVDESENWEVLNPQLHSDEANADGLALKKMIAAGGGLPLHFLAEPESSTRSTAESAGGPAYRHFEQRQEFFCWLVGDLARVVLRRRAQVSRLVRPGANILVQGADLSARDNASLAVASSTLASALLELRGQGLIDDPELLRMFYRFAGEVVDIEALLARARRAAPAAVGGAPTIGAEPGGAHPPAVALDPATGEPRGAARIE